MQQQTQGQANTMNEASGAGRKLSNTRCELQGPPPQSQTMLQGGNSPRGAAGEEQSRILLALHTAELHNLYDPGSSERLHLLSSQSIKLFSLKKACLLVKYVNLEEERL